MKKIIFLCSILVLMLASTSYASAEKASVKKISENLIEVSVSSDAKIKVTGYTINKGSNIIVYYIKDNKGKNADKIGIDINTVAKPYKVIISNSNESPNYQPFEDIKTNPMKDYIRHLFDLGYIKGYEEDNTFRPNNNITRAEFITLISRMQDLKEQNVKRENFEDLYENHWAYNDVIKAIDNNIIEGYKEGGKYFVRLDKNVTIAEASKIIDNAFKINNNSVVNYDVRFAKHWAKENIQSLLNSNIISVNDEFYKKGDLNKPATRAEIAMLLSRALGR